jgi:hypothetical protein
MKAICTFKNDTSRIRLEKNKRYEIVFAESLANRHVIVNTMAGRLEYSTWSDFYQNWQVNMTLDGTAMPD